MGFVLHGLDKDDYDREYGDITLLKRILTYFGKYRTKILFISITLLLTSLAQTVVPLLISNLLDKVNSDPTGTTVLTLTGLLLGFSIFGFFTNLINQELSAQTISSAVYDLRQDSFNSIIKHDMAFFDEQPTGRIVSRITNDTRDFGQTIQLTTQLLAQIMVVFFLLYFLFERSVTLTLIVILFAPLIIGIALTFRKIARRVARASNRVLAKVNALIQETTSGIYIAKSFRAEQTIYNEFDQLNITNYDVNLRRGFVFNSIFPILGMVTGLGTAFIIYYGGSGVINQELTIGELYLFIQGLTLFFFPLVSIASFWSQFQQGLAGAERVFSLIDRENNVIQYESQVFDEPKGKIDFNDITFAYKPGTNVLDNFSLNIKPGEKIAIVGHTGAGKSTLAKLIMRSYEFQSGQIMIDNRDIRSLDLAEYRKKLAIIPQEVFLWNGTVRDNILYGIEGKIENPEQRIEEVLQEVEALDFISNLEKRFETKVGERGNLLSQGQRQLIAFARVLLQDPFILILDEATASVDPLTELRVQNAINLLLEGRTSIVIAHRLSTVKKADRIIVMKEGKIIEQGSHEELLALEGHYAELYDTYFRHQSLAYIESIALS
ncbi:MAG: ABC transporter ATP-binding protein [Candidatus Hodarchaeales archaeon]|jgi:ABC-type multidrug transport system fused ATPase/permease subunit